MDYFKLCRILDESKECWNKIESEIEDMEARDFDSFSDEESERYLLLEKQALAIEELCEELQGVREFLDRLDNIQNFQELLDIEVSEQRQGF